MSDAAPKKRRLASLWLIIGLAAAPVVAAYVMVYFLPSPGRMNRGELLEPRPLPDAGLEWLDGSAFKLARLKGKWVLAMVDSADCGEPCRRKLHYLRQVRLAQGKNMDRVERLWLIADRAQPEPALLAGFEGTWFVRAASGPVPAAFPAAKAVSDHIYIIDPLGNLIMRYSENADPRDIVKDLERLLKASRIG